jgi:hypothetical protein
MTHVPIQALENLGFEWELPVAVVGQAPKIPSIEKLTTRLHEVPEHMQKVPAIKKSSESKSKST